MRILGPEVVRPKGSDAPSWEYYIERFSADSRAEEEMLRDAQWLNALGGQGWELANIYRLPKSAENAFGWRKEWGDALVFCIFKRRVAASRQEGLAENSEDGGHIPASED